MTASPTVGSPAATAASAPPVDPKLNMSRVIAATLSELMQADDSIVVLGEDVGGMGGVFGATRNLTKRFGADRVIDTPISEQSFVGMGVGMAQAGLRPVVEMMFVDFIGTCLDQVYNQMAKNHYMSGGRVRVPMVLRTAVGSIGDAAQHSQVLSALFGHLPGMKLAFPSCPADARGLLQTAVTSDDPVVFFEHKKLLMTRGEDLPHRGEPSAGPIPFGRAATIRDGSDLTIVASGWMVQESVTAAAELATEGIDAEVVDLRTIVPLDVDTVLDSALRTGALLVVDEDYRSFGVTAELIASVAERVPDAGIRFARSAVNDVPLPASKPLEEAVLPSSPTIAAAGRRLLGAER
jgi:pyruvate/2-oxoglutarate/acetoin dehydrogenase E1 component